MAVKIDRSIPQEQALTLRDRRLSYYVDQYDRLATPLMREVARRSNAQRPLLVFESDSGKRYSLNGRAIQSLLIQLKAVIPEIASLPPERRMDHLVAVAIPRAGIVRIKAGSIPTHLNKVYSILHPQKESRPLLTAPQIPDSPFEEITQGDVQELSGATKSAKAAFMSNLHACFFDPGNPEKGKKYIYSLYCIRNALDQKFPGWGKRLPQLLEFSSQSLFAKHAYLALEALQENGESNGDIRAQYAFILENVREALGHVATDRFQKSDPLWQGLQMILQFCHFKFTQVHMYPFFDDFIPKVLRAPQEKGFYEMPSFTLEHLAEDIQIANDRLATAPAEYRQNLLAKEFKKLQGTVGWNFDPNRNSNTSWVHSVQEAMAQQGARTCTVLRHGTPTCDPGWTGTFKRMFGFGLQATVIPEYKAHLAAEPEKISLYVNHQEFEDAGAERDRAQVIRQLEEIYSNFHFMSLPMDGPLWANLEGISIEQLKRELLHALVNQTHGFALPKALDNGEVFSQRASSILQNVHALFFNGTNELSLDAKKAFIMLFYSELKDHLKATLKVDYIVSACKDNKDRGNASTTVDMVKNLVKLGLENDPTSLREVFISALAPFIIKNEQIIPSRLKIALCVIDVLANLSDAQKAKIREDRTSGYWIQRQTVPQPQANWTQMTGPKPFLACVENMKKLKEQRVLFGPHFQKNIASTFLQQGTWKLPLLKRQLERDLPSIDIRLNGERVLQFNVLCQNLGLSADLFEKRELSDAALSSQQRDALYFMATLQQGSLAETMRDPASYLNGNATNFVVVQRSLFPTREKTLRIIAQTRIDLTRALEEARKFSEEDPNFAQWLASATMTGLLPKEFMPDGAFENQFPIPIYPTRIYGTFTPQKREIQIEQELELCNPDEPEKTYPICAMAFVKNNGSAKISWQFTSG